MEKYIDDLYDLVVLSSNNNEIPVGALVIHNDSIVGRGVNNRQNIHNVCGHAEINAIIEAEDKLGDWRLDDCILITTLHPCLMCQAVIRESRISKVYYLIDQEKNHNVSYEQLYFPGNKKCAEITEIFNDFFINLRK